MQIARFERTVRRGNIPPIIRISIDGNIYLFENSDEIEKSLIRLLSGGPQATVDIPIDVIKRKQ